MRIPKRQQFAMTPPGNRQTGDVVCAQRGRFIAIVGLQHERSEQQILGVEE